MDIPGYKVSESERFRRKQKFLAANGKALVNESEIMNIMRGETVNGKQGLVPSAFQITGVTRPLWSVSKVLDQQQQTGSSRNISNPTSTSIGSNIPWM